MGDTSFHAAQGQSLSILLNSEKAQLTIAGDGNVVSGGGRLENDVMVTSGAVVSPGGSAGLLTIDGDATIGAEGRFVVELGGTMRGHQYDALDVMGTTTLDGLLDVTLLDGFVPSAEDGFLILRAERIDGVFANAAESIMVGNVKLPVTYRNNMVIVGNAAAVPEPASYVLLAIGVFFGLLWQRRMARRPSANDGKGTRKNRFIGAMAMKLQLVARTDRQEKPERLTPA